MLKCPKCEIEVAKGKFCGDCGEKLVAVMPPNVSPQRPGTNIDTSSLENSVIDNSVKTQIDNHSTQIGSVSYNVAPQEQGAICAICKSYNKDISKTFACDYCHRKWLCEHHKRPVQGGIYCGDPNCPGARTALSQPYWGPQQYPPPPTQAHPQGYPPTYPAPGYPSPYGTQYGSPPLQSPNQQQLPEIAPLQGQPVGQMPTSPAGQYSGAVSHPTLPSGQSIEDEFFQYLLSTASKMKNLIPYVSLNKYKIHNKGYKHIYATPEKMKGQYFSYRIKKDCGEVYLHIDPNSESEARAIYDGLHKHNEEIQTVFGVKKLEWVRESGRSSVIICRSYEGSYKDRNQWDRMASEMVKDMVNLQKALIPYLQEYFKIK